MADGKGGYYNVAPPPPAYANQSPYYNGPPPPQQQQQQQHMVVVTTAAPVVLTTVTRFGMSPMQTVCPHCGAVVITSTHHDVGACAWLMCLCLCLFCWICFFLPFVMDGFKDVVHTCPNCHNTVGRCNRL
jgi:lipopolysaccharide-induced tumor necrosis factor-alpha factor